MNDGSARVYSIVGDRYTYLLTGEQTGGGCFLCEAYVLPGNGTPPHVHSREDETFYVVEGEFEFLVDGAPVRLKAGEHLFARRDVPHNFRNVGPEPGKMIITATPAGLEDFFSEIGAKLSGRDDAPVPPSPDDIARLIATAPKYGLTILGPE
jgi:quercetin dioxygenase-like cupin family protein